MPKVSEQHRVDRIRDLHRATWRVIAEHGIEDVTLDAIAAAAGVTVGAIYKYYSSRDELVDAAVDEALTLLGVTLADAVAATSVSPSALFMRVVDAFAVRAREEPFAMATASAVASTRPHLVPADPAIVAGYDGFVAAVTVQAQAWIDGGVLRGSAVAQDAARFCVSVLWGYFTQARLVDADLVAGHVAVLRELETGVA